MGCFSMELHRLLEESACNMSLKPLSREVCKIKECVPVDADWRTGDWDEVIIII